jgi:hypothetical protein
MMAHSAFAFLEKVVDLKMANTLGTDAEGGREYTTRYHK